MATLCLSSSSSVKLKEMSTYTHSFPANTNLHLCPPTRRRPFFDHFQAVNYVPKSLKWRSRISFFPFFSTKTEDTESLKLELLEAIAPLDRGAEATPEDQKRVDQIASKLEAANKVKEPLKSSLLNGKWELLYTTSQSILQTKRPKFLRANGKIYQAINTDTLRAQNIETWPFFNQEGSEILESKFHFSIHGLHFFSRSTTRTAPQATANLVPLNAQRVAVKFDSFKIASLIPIKSRGSGRGELEITYLDEELRISRGNQGNLFILRMVDPSYRVPL